jgi:hypothetical protein
MAIESSITLPAELLAQVQAIAAKEGKTADALTAEAMKREIGKRTLERLKTEADARRGNMSGERVEEYVDKLIHEYRAENRGR